MQNNNTDREILTGILVFLLLLIVIIGEGGFSKNYVITDSYVISNYYPKGDFLRVELLEDDIIKRVDALPHLATDIEKDVVCEVDIAYYGGWVRPRILKVDCTNE